MTGGNQLPTVAPQQRERSLCPHWGHGADRSHLYPYTKLGQGSRWKKARSPVQQHCSTEALFPQQVRSSCLAQRRCDRLTRYPQTDHPTACSYPPGVWHTRGRNWYLLPLTSPSTVACLLHSSLATVYTWYEAGPPRDLHIQH